MTISSLGVAIKAFNFQDLAGTPKCYFTRKWENVFSILLE